MRTRQAASIAALACALAAPLALSPARAQTAPATTGAQPYELVRTLQALQNQAAQGNAAAHVAQRKLLKDMEGPLSEPGALAGDIRNIRAIVLYVLSGGQPSVLKAVIDRGDAAGDDLTLAQGAFAYVAGDEAQARKLLVPIDAMTLPPALGAQLALVQAALIARTDTKKALQLLDQARLLAPGSLVEEAALRREVFIAGETGDMDRLQKATSQYIRRFGRSIYAENFRQSFATAVTRYDIGRDPAKFPRLVATMEAFEQPVRRAVYLIIARDALVSGRLDHARQAANAAEAIAGADPAMLARARLYAAAATLGADKPEATLAALGKVDASMLSEADGQILTAARRLATSINAPAGRVSALAPADAPAAPPRAAGTARAAAPAGNDWLSTEKPPGLDPKSRSLRLIGAAERQLAEADAMLAALAPKPGPGEETPR